MKKKRWEPDTLCGWADLSQTEKCITSDIIVRSYRTSQGWKPIRILREKDYQRLLKLSKAQKRTT